MRKGFQVYDTDTHVMPSVEVLHQYVDPDFRPRLPELDAYCASLSETAENGAPRHRYRIHTKTYRRILGQAGPHESFTGSQGAWKGSKMPRSGVQDDQATHRIQDMDDEGVDVHFLVP